ncbi:metal ABC transporter permease [Candidatus Viridilinea mediisalina]|uniref:Zinc transporter n=1 Tax=Candidatus Viridilinea mediisalina TaxID=2024553 RepID=A0A2A6RHR3_9CHLR|nr:iron chelate uptake ABC transporter family permease subunit [Candidatus Viridilinea mediisalina]PDW02481.1 zinc transporter [Candidatus Viridilinea mediisalina]
MFIDLFTDYTLRTIALGAVLLGLTSGVLGCFAVLRRQALLGDAMAHAALPGVVLAFMLTGSRAPLILVLGAAIAGWLGALAVLAIVRLSRIKEDAAFGLVLSVFFGLGMVLLTFVQRSGSAGQAGLDKYLFGQAAAMVMSDVVMIASLGALLLSLVLLFWKEFKLLSFDPEFAASQGYPVRRLDILLTSLIVVAIVLGLQLVGVVLMSALLVAPAAAARQWTNRLSTMALLAGTLGAIAGVVGALISTNARGLSTGPVIVVVISLVVLVSLLFAPERGLIWAWVRQWRNRRRFSTRQP